LDNVLPYVTGGLAVGSLHGEDGDVATTRLGARRSS
jgi:hypothetical protein